MRRALPALAFIGSVILLLAVTGLAVFDWMIYSGRMLIDRRDATAPGGFSEVTVSQARMFMDVVLAVAALILSIKLRRKMKERRALDS